MTRIRDPKTIGRIYVAILTVTSFQTGKYVDA